MRVDLRMVAALAVALAVSGCRDLGLPDRNLPLHQAETRKPQQVPTVSAVPTGTPTTIHLAEQVWTPSGAVFDVPDRLVRPVGSTAGLVFYALDWDRRPFDRLLVARRGGGWTEYLEVPGLNRVDAAGTGAEGG